MPQREGVWLALLLFAANPTLVVGSATDCPSAADVAVQLTPLLPAGVVASAGVDAAAHADDDPDRGDVTIEEGQRWVRLHRHNQRLNHERAIPASLGCIEAARAAAVLIAAWEFQGQAPVDLPDAAPPAPPAPAKTPSLPAPAPTVASKPSAPAPIVAARPPAIPAPRAPRRLGLGGGVSAAAHTDRLVTEVAAEVLLGPAAGIGWRVQLATTSQDSLPIGGGRATWTRSSVALGSMLAQRRGRLGLQVHGDLLGAILSITGEDLPTNEHGTQAAFGISVGARGVLGLGAGGDLWLDLKVTDWPGRHQVLLRGAMQGSDLPVAEVAAGVGVDFFVWP